MANLQQPILDLQNGVRNVHFFNGRLLTGEDLREEQAANARQHASLALAIGSGIVTGLEVTLKTKSPPAVTVTAGRAINRLGQVLELQTNTDVSLRVDAATSSAGGGDELFSACPQTSLGAGTEDFTGAFLLVMGPVFAYSGQAPKHETYDAGIATGCGTAYAVQGVQFHLVELKLGDLSQASDTQALIQALMTAGDIADQSKLRNILAHACLGTEDLARFAVEPFAGSTVADFNRYGALDRLRADGRLDDCAVPLALTFWTEDGLQFIDMWSVRRLVVLGDESPWAPWVAPRRVAEGQAAFQQFQLHLEELLKNPSNIAAGIVARDYFRFLPPVGLVPIATATVSTGLHYAQFFSGMILPEPVAIDGRQLRPLLDASYHYGATDLDADEFHWVYNIQENQAGGSLLQRYVVFANGLLPYQGDTRQNTKVLLLPVPEPVRVGDEIHVLGAGFRVPARLNDLFLDDLQVTAFNPGTSATRFVFNVPSIPQLGSARVALLRLSNSNGSASTPITVLPAAGQVPDGAVLVTLLTTDLGTVNQGETYMLGFQVDSQTNIAETYALSLLYTNLVGSSQNAWRAATAIRDLTGAVITSVTAAPGNPVIVRVAVTIPTDAESATLSLRVASLNNPAAPLLTVNSTPLELAVGSEVEASDPRVQFERFEAVPPASLVDDPQSGLLLTVPPSTTVLVRVTANLGEPGTYQYLAGILPEPAGGWSAQRIAPASGQSIETASGGEQTIVAQVLSPASDPSPSRTLEIRATREGNAASGQDRIASWFRISLRIAG